MKSISFINLIIIFTLTLPDINKASDSLLDGLFKSRSYFEYRDEFEKRKSNLSLTYKQYYEALLESVFNEPESANKRINSLIGSGNPDITDSMKMNLLKSKINNSVNLFEYGDALEATNILLKTFKDQIEKDETEELVNSALIWDACRELAKQTVEKSGDTKLLIKKDIAGLTNVNLDINNVSMDFIFDTGANFSTISESAAHNMNLVFLKNKIKVGSITGNKVESGLAYAEVMEIGNMKFKNVLFLVMPDEALSFGGGMYVIKGIIGFPVLKEMQEIHLSKDEIFIPEITGTSVFSNLALDGFIPVIETLINSDTLVFSFDTGAKRTTLYYEYYRKNKKNIDSLYEPVELKLGGAGGEVMIPGYKLKEVNIEISSKTILLEEVSLLSKVIQDNDKYLHGNLGSDFINSFSIMKINFEKMYVEFIN